MADWIHSYAGLRSHPKLKKLARQLKISERETIGLLHCLWWWAMEYAPSGELGKYGPEDIAEGIGWEGDATHLLESLREAMLLDDMYLHDWDQYGGKLHAKREADAERKRQARTQDKSGPSKDDSRTSTTPSNGRPTDVTWMSQVEESRVDKKESTFDQITAPNDSESAEQHASNNGSNGSNNGSNGSKPSAFDAFWEVYPVKKGKKKAREAFKTACKETTAENITAAIRSQADHLVHDGPEFCPHPTTWLHHGRWEDEITPEKTALQQVDEYWGARDDES